MRGHNCCHGGGEIGMTPAVVACDYGRPYSAIATPSAAAKPTKNITTYTPNDIREAPRVEQVYVFDFHWVSPVEWRVWRGG